ncbi:MAG: DUF2306 domain-containing protein, partial [Kordiimonas sp.]
YPVAAYAHFVFGPLALMIGGFQFNATLRVKAPVIHRAIGWLYVFSCLTSSVGGLILAINTQSGIWVATGFGSLSILWFYTTFKATVLAARKQFANHKAWMVRSYALTLAAITFRLVFLIILPSVSGLDFELCYMIGSWLCWLINLALAEIWLRQNSPKLTSNILLGN